MTLPRGSVSDLPFSLNKSWELVCLRTTRSVYRPFPEGHLRTLRQTGAGPNFAVNKGAYAAFG